MWLFLLAHKLIVSFLWPALQISIVAGLSHFWKKRKERLALTCSIWDNLFQFLSSVQSSTIAVCWCKKSKNVFTVKHFLIWSNTWHLHMPDFYVLWWMLLWLCFKKASQPKSNSCCCQQVLKCEWLHETLGQCLCKPVLKDFALFSLPMTKPHDCDHLQANLAWKLTVVQSLYKRMYISDVWDNFFSTQTIVLLYSASVQSQCSLLYSCCCMLILCPCAISSVRNA